MNQLKTIGVLAACSLLMASCDDGLYQGSPSGEGKLSVALDVNTSALSSRSTDSRAWADNGVVDVSDLKIKMTSLTDETRAYTWDSVDEFKANNTFPVDRYLFEAYYGDAEAEGFDLPYYYANAEVEIREAQTTELGLTVAMANSMLTIEYSEAMETYLADYYAEIITDQTYRYSPTETRAVYVKPGDVTLRVYVKKHNGVEATIEAATITAKPRYHYIVRFDINEGKVGEGEISITFDDDMEYESAVIDLSDELLRIPAPVISADGFELGAPVDYQEGQTLAFNVMAMAGLKTVTLTTDPASALGASWPASIELMGADATVQQTLTSHGLKARGLWRNPDKMAVVDVTDLLWNVHVPAGQDALALQFGLTAVDRYGKVPEADAVMMLNVPKMIALSNPGVCLSTRPSFTVELKYNGTDASEVTYKYKPEGSDEWLDLGTFGMATVSGGYKVTLAKPAVTSKFALKAVCGQLETAEVEIPYVDLAVELDEADVWTRSAYVTVLDAGMPYSGPITFLLSSNGGATYAPAEAEQQADGRYLLAGLTPGTNYVLMVTLTGDIADAMQLTFATEAETQLPNSGMEEWYMSDNGANWQLWHPASSLPSIWGTNNPMTTSPVGNSNAYSAISGTMSTDDGHTGKAALVRSVGWGSGNDAKNQNYVIFQRWTTTMKYGDAGLLHLGSSRIERPAGANGVAGVLTTDDLDCGIDIASRPSSMTFWYKYTARNTADKGRAEISLYDADGNVLSSAVKDLSAAEEYTKVELPLGYAAGAGKAAKIYVKFLSTNNATYLAKNNSNFTDLASNQGVGAFIGSELYIDDITLNY